MNIYICIYICIILHFTSTLYIWSIDFFQNKWNLIMVFEHNVKGNFPVEKFEEELRQKTFVKDLEVIPFTSKPLYTQAMNSYFSIKAYLGSVFPSVFGGTLTKIIFKEESMSAWDKKLTAQCKGKTAKDASKPVIMVNINRKKKTNNDNETYGKHVLMNLFPLIGSRIYMLGKPESDYWDMIALVRYQSEGKLCEMALSEEYNRIKPLKQSGLDDSYTSLTATVLAYQKELVE